MAPVRRAAGRAVPRGGAPRQPALRPRARRPTTPPSSTGWWTGFDAYVNEAFGVAHRAHASVVGPADPPAQRGRPPAGPRGRGPRRAARHARPGPSWPWWAGPRWPTSWGSCGRWPRGPTCWPSAGRMAFTFLAAHGPRRGRVAGRPRPGGGVPARCCTLGRPRSCCRPTWSPWSPAASSADRSAEEPGRRQGRGRATSPTAGTGLDIGPETAEAFADGHRRRPDGVLERPAWGCSRTTGSPPAPTRVAEAVADCAGFTVVGGGDSVSALDHLGPGRPGRLRLDRRRGLAVAARARGPARRWRPCARASNAPSRRA